MKDIAHGIFWIQVLVAMCQDGGVGARMLVRAGGKICADPGEAVDLEVTMRAIHENMAQKRGDPDSPTGTGVWPDADEVQLIVSTLCTQSFAPSVCSDLGIDIEQRRALIPESTDPFHRDSRRISRRAIHLRAPGTVMADMSISPFIRRDGNDWAQVENPFN